VSGVAQELRMRGGEREVRLNLLRGKQRLRTNQLKTRSHDRRSHSAIQACKNWNKNRQQRDGNTGDARATGFRLIADRWDKVYQEKKEKRGPERPACLKKKANEKEEGEKSAV